MQKPTLSTALSIFNTGTSCPLTMTLKEITDILKVRHNDAMKVVENMAESSDFGALRKSRIAYNQHGQTTETYALDKRQSIAVAAKLNTSLLMNIIDRWQELEGAAPKPLTQIEQVRLLLESLEREEELKNLIAEGKYLSVKQLRKMYGWGTFSGKDLTALSISEGYDVKYFGGEAGNVATSVSQPGLYHIEVVTSYLREQWLDFDHERQQRILNNGHVLPFNID